MRHRLHSLLLSTAFALGTLITQSTHAAPYHINFFETGGNLAGTGVFDTPTGPVGEAITSFTATVAGTTWDTLAPNSQFPNTPSFGTFYGTSYLQGFIFENAADIGSINPVNVLQLFASGTGQPDGSVIVTDYWAISQCIPSVCGGGTVRGYVEISTFSEVPAPATLPLALLALAALRFTRRKPD